MPTARSASPRSTTLYTLYAEVSTTFVTTPSGPAATMNGAIASATVVVADESQLHVAALGERLGGAARHLRSPEEVPDDGKERAACGGE